jgi:hypothetical protein
MKKLEPLHRISVCEAAEALGMCTDSVRYMMKKGTLPIGRCMEGRGRTTYYIYREFVEQYMRGER